MIVARVVVTVAVDAVAVVDLWRGSIDQGFIGFGYRLWILTGEV